MAVSRDTAVELARLLERYVPTEDVAAFADELERVFGNSSFRESARRVANILRRERG